MDATTPAYPHIPPADLHAGAPGDEDAQSDDGATPLPDYIRRPGREVRTNSWGQVRSGVAYLYWGQAFVRGGGISFRHDLPPSHPAAGA